MNWRKVVFVVACGFLCACAGPPKKTSAPNMGPYQTYTSAHVATFKEDLFLKGFEKNDKGPADAARVPFREMLAQELKRTGRFQRVTSGQVLTQGKRQNIFPSTLLVEGEITAYEEGNSAFRLIIGHGMGGGHFAAEAAAKGGPEKKDLGNVWAESRTSNQVGLKSSLQDLNGLMRDVARQLAQGIADKAE